MGTPIEPVSHRHPSGDEAPRILIVDDEPGWRHTLTDIFQECGYCPVPVATGREALHQSGEQSFAAAIMDVRLPDMLGTELLARIKQQQPDAAAIVVTAYATLQTCMSAMNAGAFAYLPKPVNIEHLQQVVEQALDVRQQRFEGQSRLQQAQARVRELEQTEVQLSDRIRHLEQELAARPAGGASGEAQSADA